MPMLLCLFIGFVIGYITRNYTIRTLDLSTLALCVLAGSCVVQTWLMWRKR